MHFSSEEYGTSITMQDADNKLSKKKSKKSSIVRVHQFVDGRLQIKNKFYRHPLLNWFMVQEFTFQVIFNF